MAVFDEEYYTGCDQYSDGDIEDTILSIVEQGRNWKAMQHIPYAVLYHLSEERENILSWYPFRKNCRILEVGSGCGAITGLLCRRSEEVVSVELSKRRGWINYIRNKDCENLTIRIGNLNDMCFAEPFDYVILNGVFEYAASFTEGEYPYEIFLNRIKEYCKPDGHILIAIENRLGLKYFSGASEDHTNVHFLGLNEYQGNQTVRTFSRSEMEKIAASCGLQQIDFYYPYPDYKFPVEVFTDETINESNYGRPYANLSDDRCLVFDESKMAHTLCQEKVMGSFANSFLVDLARTKQQADRVIYAKMCSGRREEFQIQTCIYANEEGKRYVEKGPLSVQADSHMVHIKNAEKIFDDNRCKVLTSVWNERKLQYPYLKEFNVQAILKDCLKSADQKALCREIERVFDVCVPQGRLCNYQTEAFRRMFGDFPGMKDEECVQPANVDLIFENIFVSNKGYTIIDPEWWGDFAIPRKFLLWRTLNEFYAVEPEANEVWPRNECMRYFSISEQQQKIFRNWAVYFAEHYVGQSVTYRCGKPVHSIRLDQWIQEIRIGSSLYLDTGNGFSEDEKIFVETYCDNGQFELRFDLSKYKNIQGLRWDPVENVGIRCKLDRVQMEETGAECTAIPVNGVREGEEDVFYTLDPQYSIQKKKQNDWSDVLLITGILQYLEPTTVFAYEEQKAKHREEMMKNQLTQLNDQLLQMNSQLAQMNIELENTRYRMDQTVLELAAIKRTKWWKIYSRVKHIIK